jgi:hypothetical protein
MAHRGQSRIFDLTMRHYWLQVYYSKDDEQTTHSVPNEISSSRFLISLTATDLKSDVPQLRIANIFTKLTFYSEIV